MNVCVHVCVHFLYVYVYVSCMYACVYLHIFSINRLPVELIHRFQFELAPTTWPPLHCKGGCIKIHGLRRTGIGLKQNEKGFDSKTSGYKQYMPQAFLAADLENRDKRSMIFGITCSLISSQEKVKPKSS